MKKVLLMMLVMLSCVLMAEAQEATYKIIVEKDSTIKYKVKGITIGSRDVRYIVYEYQSKDPKGNDATISGVILAPLGIVNGTVPSDGILLYNHYTISALDEAPSSEIDRLSGAFMCNPLKPNYVLVMSDYIGFGSSKDKPQAYLCGDTNARNSLDGLLAAKALMKDKGIPEGRYLFNMGYSQGGTESMFAAKLSDMEYKDKGVTFDKTFSGGGPLDIEKAYTEYVRIDYCDYVGAIAQLIIAYNEWYGLGLDYHDAFQEPLASHVQEWFLDKKLHMSQITKNIGSDSVSHMLTPTYFDVESEEAKTLRKKLRAESLMDTWTPDTTQKYFLFHSRHDRYVPVQTGRVIIPWMKKKGFTPSIVPGKTNLQTNTVVFKLNHDDAAIVWFIQTAAAIQVWPALYYEGGQNRYYHNVVKDLNIMRVIKTLESWGIDLRKIVKNSNAPQLVASHRANRSGILALIMDLIPGVKDALAKVDLTPEDAEEMLEDAGITIEDIGQVVLYFLTSPSSAPEADSALSIYPFSENVEAPVQLLRLYEQTLANWFMLGGINVEYEKWGW
ncbi:MAG: hypothetical protein IJQ49_05540 [Prevotella sp.]|nr:hypothetical protein [Prevotella sp.]